MGTGGKTGREPGWLLLIHQIPPKPNYFRVKIWRRLQRLGAVAIKNSVYAMPASDQAHEDLNWVLREIVEGGGDASLVEARFVEGLGDEQVKEMFRSARDAEYREVAEEARELSRKLPRKGEASEEKRAELEPQLLRLQKRIAEIATVDFFHGRGREPLEGLIQELAERLAPSALQLEASRAAAVEKPRGRTWVTRTGIHVDRMASAWLIRRFIDPGARFKFVNAREYRHKEGELRFDMFDGEYTHKGELLHLRGAAADVRDHRRGTATDRRDRPRHRPEGREVRTARYRWDRDAHQRHRHGPSRGRRAARARQRGPG